MSTTTKAKLSATQQSVLNHLLDFEPGLRKGQISNADNGDILLGDIHAAGLSKSINLLRGSLVGGQVLTAVPAAYIGQRAKALSVSIQDMVGVAANNTDYVVITVTNAVGGKVVASYDSRAAHQGAIAASGVAALFAMVPNSDGADLLAAGTSLVVNATSHGAAVLTSAAITLYYTSAA